MKKSLCILASVLMLGNTVFAKSNKTEPQKINSAYSKSSVPQWIKDSTCLDFHIFCGREKIKVDELLTKTNAYTKITRAEVTQDSSGSGFNILAIDYENKEPGYTANYLTIEFQVNPKTSYARLYKVKLDIPEAQKSYYYEDDENGYEAFSFFPRIMGWFLDL